MSKATPKKKSKSRSKTSAVPKSKKVNKTAKPDVESYTAESVMDDLDTSEISEPKPKVKKRVKKSETSGVTTKKKKNTDDNDIENTVSVSVLDDQTRRKIKANANIWFDLDDALKNLGKQAKTLRKKKTELGKKLLKIQEDNGVEDAKFDVEGKDGKVRGRLSNTLSVTRGPITQKLIETVIMEYSVKETMAKQIAKKIEERRPVKERRYLKRTKGASDNSKEKD